MAKKKKPKSPNGLGGVFQRKDGRWEARYTVQTPAGLKRKSVYAKNKTEALQKLAKAISDRDGGVAFDPTNITFGEYLDRWLSDAVRDSVKERTLLTYEQAVRKHLKPFLGHLKLKDLKPAHLRALYRAKLDAGLSAQSVLAVHSVARNALGQAVRWDLVLSNAAAAAKPPRPRREEIVSLTREEAQELIATARREGHRLEALYACALATGLRHGELLALRWSDVTLRLEGGELAVRRSLGRALAKKHGGAGYAFGTPKTGKARVVGFGPGIAAVLRSHRARQAEENLAAGPAYTDTDLVFTDEAGGILPPHKSTRVFRALASAAGLRPDLRFHDLRHTAATLAILKNVRIKVIQEMLGHSKISQTLDTYSHVLKSMQDDAATKMDDVLFGAEETDDEAEGPPDFRKAGG